MIEKVLVVDDEPLMLRFVAEVLKRQGKEVTLAQNGEEAIRLLGMESFDLVISDQASTSSKRLKDSRPKHS